MSLAGFAVAAVGDFVGDGRWTFTQHGPEVAVVYDWRIRADKPLLQAAHVAHAPDLLRQPPVGNGARRGEPGARAPAATRRGIGKSAGSHVRSPDEAARLAPTIARGSTARAGCARRACERRCARGCARSRRDTDSAAAISPLERPSCSRPRTSASRGVRTSWPAVALAPRGTTCSPRDARWIVLSTSRLWTSRPRHAAAPSASSWLHSLGDGSCASTTIWVVGWARCRRLTSPGSSSATRLRIATRGTCSPITAERRSAVTSVATICRLGSAPMRLRSPAATRSSNRAMQDGDGSVAVHVPVLSAPGWGRVSRHLPRRSPARGDETATPIRHYDNCQHGEPPKGLAAATKTGNPRGEIFSRGSAMGYDGEGAYGPLFRARGEDRGWPGRIPGAAPMCAEACVLSVVGTRNAPPGRVHQRKVRRR